MPSSPTPPRATTPPPMRRAEGFLVLLLAIHLSFLPWAWGTMHAWSQWTSLGAAAGIFLLALLLNVQPAGIPGGEPRWKRLFKFPAFWAGLLLLTLVTIHALNPAWRFVEFEEMFWMVPIDYIEWLPSGMDTPFEQMSASRHLIVLGSAFLTILTISRFISSSRALRLLVILLVLNGLALTAVGFAQILLQADKILWMRPPANVFFLSSFIYRNHGAAYLNLIFAAAIALYSYFLFRSWNNFNRPRVDASPLFFFAALSIFTLVVFSQSRGGAIVAVGLAITSVVYTLVRSWIWRRFKETVGMGFLYGFLFALFTGTFVWILGWSRVVERFQRLMSAEGEVEWERRSAAYRATWDMFRDSPVFGWGAGSFEYFFPVYQAYYPEIHMRAENLRWVWEYAHSDPLQLLAEYGIVGAGLFALLIACWFWGFTRNGGWGKPFALWCALAAAGALAHSTVDFIFYNPAVLITAAALLAISYRYALLERQRRRRDLPPPGAYPPSQHLPEGVAGPRPTPAKG